MKTIYLQLCEDSSQNTFSDRQINDHDIKYIRADQVTELLIAQVQACVKQQQSGKLVSWTELIPLI